MPRSKVSGAKDIKSLQTQQFPKQGAVVQACNPSIREEEAGESEAEGHPELHSEFEASLGCMRLYLNNQRG